jgi:hypothetical protein
MPREVLMSGQVFGEIQLSQIEQRVNEVLEKRRGRLFGYAAFFGTILVVLSGAVIWAVQVSGTLAGEKAAREAVDREIGPERSAVEASRAKVEELRAATAELKGKAEASAEEAQKARERAGDLQSKLATAQTELEKAHELFTGKYKALVQDTVDNEGFRKAVANDALDLAAGHLSEMDKVVAALRENALRTEGGAWTANINTPGWTLNKSPHAKPASFTSPIIKFSRPFRAPPVVHVSLDGFDFDKTANSHIGIEEAEVTTHGFNVVVSTWDNSIVGNAVVRWVAIGADAAAPK